VTVEVQIRTEAMNFWASLEHRVKYKFEGKIPKHLSDELSMIADQTSQLDQRMFNIHELVGMVNQEVPSVPFTNIDLK